MKYLVIGLGNTGLAIASMLRYAGLDVEGYNRPGKTLENIKSISQFKVKGLADFTLESDFITDDLKSAINRAELVFVCVPANEHKSLAVAISQELGPHVRPSIILVPGRVFGAVNFQHYLNFTVAEAQTVPYAARHDGAGVISLYAKKNKVLYSSPDIDRIVDVDLKMPEIFKSIFHKDCSYKKVTMSNVGLILHCAPLVFNSGLIKYPANFLFYKDLVSKEIGYYMQKLDEERVKIADGLGVEVDFVADWLREQYGAKNISTIYSALQSTDAYGNILAPTSLNHRYLNEDLVYGLLPIEFLSEELGVKVPYTTNLINSACMLMNCDLRLNYQGIIPDWRGMK